MKRSRRARPAAAALGLLVLAIPIPGRAAVITLPSASNNPPVSSFFGPRPGALPNRAPGPIAGREIVTAGLDPTGELVALDVDQTLSITGTGDYTIEIPAQAKDVSAPEGSRAKPGLRAGSIVWEGFSPGHKDLISHISLAATAPRFVVLPFSVHVSVTRAGVLIQPPYDGDVDIEVHIENVTNQMKRLSGGTAEPAALARAVEATRAALRHGVIATGGARGIPRSVPMRAAGKETLREVFAPFRVHGEVEIAKGAFSGPLRGAIDGLLPSVRNPRGVLDMRWHGNAQGLQLRVNFDAVASGSDVHELDRGDTRALEQVLWEGVRARDYDAFIGNPLGGQATARYVFAPVPEAPKVVAKPKERAHPIPIAIAALLVLGLMAGARELWRRN